MNDAGEALLMNDVLMNDVLMNDGLMNDGLMTADCGRLTATTNGVII